MNFERGQDPKEAMKIGVESKTVLLEKCRVHFKIDKEDEENNKPVTGDDLTKLLDMWESGYFRHRKMIEVLHLRGFWKILTLIRVQKIVLNIAIVDEGKLQIGGNYITAHPFGKEKIFVKYGGRIYYLPVSKSELYWII